LIKGEIGSSRDPNSGGGVTVNDEKWWKRRVEDVPIDQVFFHKYFNQKSELEKARTTKAKKRKKAKGDEGGSEVESDGEEDRDEVAEDGTDNDEEAEVWSVMKASMPKELVMSEDEVLIPSDLDEEDEEDPLIGLEDFDLSEGHAEERSDDDDVKLSLVESSDTEDLIPLVEVEEMAFKAVPIDWLEEDEEWTGFGSGSPALGEKRKRNGNTEEKRRKKARSLPTFASYDDYAKLIEEGPEDDI